MKLYCKSCNTFVGEMLKGKLKKGSAILCTECMGKYDTYKSLADYNKGTGNSDGTSTFINELVNAMGKSAKKVGDA